MPNKLTITFLVGALALARVPAFALDLPDAGSKNFNPSGDTPSYFSNETAPVSARTADTTERDWSAVDALAPDRPAADPASSAHQRGRHGKYASTQRSGRHGAGKSSGKGQSTPFTKVSAGKGTSKKPVSAKTTAGKHGKTGARHARADIPTLLVTV
jgi:hypothetical protein